MTYNKTIVKFGNYAMLRINIMKRYSLYNTL